MILDEATSSVDPENEQELMEAIQKLTQEKTVIMIAHRLKTVRHADQILVTERCFTTCHLDDITEPRLRRYMKHDLFMMFGISILTTRLNKSAETDAELKKMWETCMAYDPKWANYFRKRTPLLFISVPGRAGQEFAGSFYRFANNVVRFN